MGANQNVSGGGSSCIIATLGITKALLLGFFALCAIYLCMYLLFINYGIPEMEFHDHVVTSFVDTLILTHFYLCRVSDFILYVHQESLHLSLR